MENFVKKTSKFISVVSILLSPFALIIILFGLSGSDSRSFLLIGLGYFGVILFSLISVRRYKFFIGIIISLILIIAGVILDHIFWAEENSNICKEVKADPSCVESACGFQCSDFKNSGTGATIPGTVCKDKDMSLCI